MDIGKALNESLEYAKDAVWGKWVRWILLIVSTIIFPLILGYELEVYRGKKPAPELANWGKLFVDGILLFIIELIYAIPVIIVALVLIGSGVILAMSSPQALIAGAGTIIVGVLATLIVAFVVVFFAVMGAVRFARTGKMGEAFNFTAILGKIGKIGWGTYIISLIVIAIVAGIIAFILSLIPVIGMLLLLIVEPALVIFVARYITLLYDSVPDQAAAPAA